MFFYKSPRAPATLLLCTDLSGLIAFTKYGALYRFKGLVCLYHPSTVTLCLEGPPSKKGLLLPRKEGFPCGLAGKESACNAGDLGSIPGLERSPGEGRGYRLQYSGLENSMDCSPPGHRVRHSLPFPFKVLSFSQRLRAWDSRQRSGL